MKSYLMPQYDARKSFYGKAKVETGETTKLYSYDTLVAEIKEGKAHVYNVQSGTTLRHVKEFLKQNNFVAETKKQVVSDYMV